MIHNEEISKVVNILVQNTDLEKIILFGSYAAGNPNEDSDLDLLIIKDTNIPRYKRVSEIRKFLRGLKIPMDILVYNKQEIDKWRNIKSAFITQVLETGKILYERKI